MLQWLRAKFGRRRVAPVARPATPRPVTVPVAVVPTEEDLLAALMARPEQIDPNEVALLEGRMRMEVAAGKIDIPPMPSAAARLLELVSRPNIDLNALVAAMHWEPAVVAEILATANSAAFGGRDAIHDDLRGAIMALGIQEVGVIAAGVTARSLFSVRSKAERSLYPGVWTAVHREAMTVAFGASALAQARHMPRHDRVFLRAVLAGAARTVALRALSTQLLEGRCADKPAPATILAAIDGVHRDVAALAIESWALPAAITQQIDRASLTEAAIVDLVATLIELRRAPGRIAVANRARALIATLDIQPSWVRVIFSECDDAEKRVASMLGERN